MSKKHHLGELQYAIMRVLWASGEASAADVCSRLGAEHRRAPTTIATMLTKMEKKGVVEHRAIGRRFRYRPLIDEADVKRSMVAELTQRLFGGDVSLLVTHLITEGEIDADELDRLQRRLADEVPDPDAPTPESPELPEHEERA